MPNFRTHGPQAFWGPASGGLWAGPMGAPEPDAINVLPSPRPQGQTRPRRLRTGQLPQRPGALAPNPLTAGSCPLGGRGPTGTEGGTPYTSGRRLYVAERTYVRGPVTRGPARAGLVGQGPGDQPVR